MNKLSSTYCLAALFALVVALTSCNDWLDVRTETEQKEKDQFSTVKGFETALTGCYMQMADQNAYGLRMTITNVENLAHLWSLHSRTTRYEDKAMQDHDYKSDYSRSAVKAMYQALFKAISQANLIIANAETHKEVFIDEQERAVIVAEAHAIRAYCQMDVLRLFGQMPVNGKKAVSLPYSESVNIDVLPPYYNFNDYVAKLTADLDKAETYLKVNDPIIKFPFERLNSTNASYETNDYLIFRQFRLNYYAVRALRARLALYTGDTAKAHEIAMELINAKDSEGKPVRALSGLSDFNNGYKTCPNECLFALSKYDILSYITSHLPSTADDARFHTGNLTISQQQLTDLYAGENIASHNRYLNLWNQRVTDEYGKLWNGLTKYIFSDNASNKNLYYQLIPMLRMSEIYLIAMEASTDLNEVNTLYKAYMTSHNVTTMPEFTSLDEAKTYIVNEYRRELFGEGQMFYTYKRIGATTMLWDSTTLTEDAYILPLPETEFDPAKTN